MSTHLYVSTTAEEAARLVAGGPRRDFVELAHATGGTVHYRTGAAKRGWLGKFWGPHLRQAWAAAGACREGGRLYLDGEHIGAPAALLLALRRRKPASVVLLGHYLTQRWKLPLIWLASRVGPRATLFVHSETQARAAQRWLGPKWECRLLPYQVDTEYWSGGQGAQEPLVLCAGSEHRDYRTLAQAVEGLDARVIIAAGSHWAREQAGAKALPANVEYVPHALGFAELRELYRRAAVVVVPLEDVENQSGVTTLLEAMSCGVPVVVTATRGQREVVAGQLVASDGRVDETTTADRGPQRFEQFAGQRFAPTGYYVRPGDAAALRAAIRLLLGDTTVRARLGRAGRETAERCFGIERYTAALARALDKPREERADVREVAKA